MTDAASKSPALLMKMHEPLIDPDAIWKDDRLGREAIALRLTELISTIEQPFVISLQAPYGSGKTFFLARWRQELLNAGHSAIIVDAWKSDFSKDPLIAFISAIRNQLPEISGTATTALKDKLTRLAQKASGVLVTKAVPILAKALVEKAIGQSGTRDILESLNLGEISEGVLEEALKGQEAAEKSIEAFRGELEGLAESLSESNNDANKGKLIILVDELDRCRPDYAISLLECVKHFFSARGVIFLLALDDRQLKSSIRSVYGDIDGDGYLARFIDIRLRLPKPNLTGFIEAQWESYGLVNIKGIDRQQFIESFIEFSEVYNLQLRQQVQLFTLVNLAIRISLVRRYAWLFPIFAILRMKEEEGMRAALKSENGRSSLVHTVSQKFKAAKKSSHEAIDIELLMEVITTSRARAGDLRTTGTKREKDILEQYTYMTRELHIRDSILEYICWILDEAEQMTAR